VIPSRAQTILVERALALGGTTPDTWTEAVERVCDAAVLYADTLKAAEYRRRHVAAGRARCSVKGCDGLARAGGMCEPHYRRKRVGAPLIPIRRRAFARPPA
jgi:hypothetical protein